MSHEAPTVEEYLIRKQKRREYEKKPAGRFKGILIAVEKSTDPQIPDTQLRDLVKRGRQAINLKPRLGRLTKQRSEAYKELIKGAVEHPGFGGFDVPESKSNVRIGVKDEIEWYGEVLKDRLGKTASAVVSEKLQMTFAVPLGHVTPDGEVLTSEKAKAAFYAGVLAPLGFEGDDEATTADVSTVYTVNEKLLAEMVQQDQVGSLEGTGTVTREFKVEVNS